MATSSYFLHPALGFLALVVFLPLIRGAIWRWLLLIPPIIAIYAVFTMTEGNHCTLTWLGQTLKVSRVDKLSFIFAQVFAIMSLAGMLYAMHVKDKLQHVMAALYVSGGFGCVFAGDFLTLFLFWELMSIGSTFLVFCNRTRESTLAAFRYFIYHNNPLGGITRLPCITKTRIASIMSSLL